MAAAGVVLRLWSSVPDPAGRMPGLTIHTRSAPSLGQRPRQSAMAAPDAITPSQPCEIAASARPRIHSSSVTPRAASAGAMAARSVASRLETNGTVSRYGVSRAPRAAFAAAMSRPCRLSCSVRNPDGRVVRQIADDAGHGVPDVRHLEVDEDRPPPAGDLPPQAVEASRPQPRHQQPPADLEDADVLQLADDPQRVVDAADVERHNQPLPTGQDSVTSLAPETRVGIDPISAVQASGG